jgi:hypothetical protein
LARKKFARGGLRDIMFFNLKSENWSKTRQNIYIYFNYKMQLAGQGRWRNRGG